jgi:UDP-glucuronate decarboxylase
MIFLVAGGAGFLGSNLTDRLLKEGHKVVVLDDFSTGTLENLAHHRDNQNLQIINQDVTSIIDLDVDGIFNLACPASPIQYQLDPVQTIRTSFVGSLNMLELAKKRGIRIFQASTSEIYGDPTVSPQVEEYWGNVNPIGIRACYDEGKRAAETLFFDFHRQYGTDIKVARIFNTYGPRMAIDDGRVVTNFIASALRGEPITIYGQGNQTRSFCYVDDLIDGFMLLFSSDSSVQGPINLGNPAEFTMLELANIVLELTNSSSKITYLPLPQDDPKQRCPDISKAIEKLAWTPKIDLKQGLTRTIESMIVDKKLARPQV